jgi:hypothetical protein
MRKIEKHAGPFLSGIDRNILSGKFGQAPDQEVIAAMIEEDASESATWIDHFRAEIS